VIAPLQYDIVMLHSVKKNSDDIYSLLLTSVAGDLADFVASDAVASETKTVSNVNLLYILLHTATNEPLQDQTDTLSWDCNDTQLKCMTMSSVIAAGSVGP